MSRWLPEGLAQAGSGLVERLRQRRVSVPVPESALMKTLGHVQDPTLRGLTLEIGDGGRLTVRGEKRKGVWVAFSVTFIAVAPSPGSPGQCVELYLERTSPFFAGPLVLKALDRIEEMEVVGGRARVRLDRWVEEQEWAQPLPSGVLDRIRVVGVASDAAERRLLVTLGWAGGS